MPSFFKGFYVVKIISKTIKFETIHGVYKKYYILFVKVVSLGTYLPLF